MAGRELGGGAPGPWIRPVSDRQDEEVSEYERQYEDGSDPRLLDILDVPLRQPRPKGYQTENWLLDAEEYWVRVGRIAWTDLAHLAEAGGALWINGHHTFNGQNDYIPLDRAGAVTTSLKLIRVEQLQLSVFRPGEAFGDLKRRVQARFLFSGQRDALWVTDPPIETEYKAHPDADYDLGESYLTISLGEPYNNRCYKLVAAVIRP